jgi:cysteine desulfurase
MIYLDANATEIIRPEARKAAIAALDLSANPSSIHGPGRAARKIMEQARSALASRVGVDAADIVFTSGGTEANCLAIASLAAGRRVAIGATEHDAVRMAAPAAEILPVQADGAICLAALERFLRQDRPALICLMLANNETGVVHPIEPAAALCRAHGALLHVDAVQGLNRMPVDLADLGAHSLAVSGHKAGGPKGAGALVLAPGLPIVPIISGGGQERGRRGGTPDLAAIAGFGAAIGLPVDTAGLAALRDRLEAASVACGATVCGAGSRLPNTTCLALPGAAAQAQVISLDLAGFAVSAGAACSSGKVSRSRVLEAMGLTALADCAIRVSLPWNATAEHIVAFGAAYAAMAARLRR